MFSVYLLRVHNTIKRGGHRARSGQQPIKLGVSENPPFYQCARANARAKVLSKALQTKGVWGYARPENLEI